MAIQVEIWENDIVAGLYKDNQFLNYAFNADTYVLQGKVVHIPNAGAPPNVQRNRATLPATAVKRTDVDITYNLDEFTTDPMLLVDAEKAELSYDKRNSLLSEAKLSLADIVAEYMLVNWSPGVSVKTGGSPVPGHTPSFTGTRKALVADDIRKLALRFDSDNVPSTERYLMLDANMYHQLVGDLSQTQYRDFSSSLDQAKGIVGNLYGFNIMKRSLVLVYDRITQTAAKAIGAAAAGSDCAAGLAWQKNSVERALGEVKFFENVGKAEYYGDIYSALVRMGGRIRRNDGKGVVALIQDWVS